MTSTAHPRPAVRLRAGAATLALATAVALAGCTGDGTRPASDETSASPRPTATDPGQTTTDVPTEDPTEQPTDEPTAAGTAVPLYFAGDGPGGEPRLFREFQRVPDDPLTAAARVIAGGGEPEDPDYRTLWPQVEIAAVTATDGVLLVQIPSDAFTERPDGMTPREARLALQQLVYTLQGVQQERVPVQVDRGDSPARLFGLRTDRPFTAASALRTLNLVSITSPAEGDSVTGDTLTVTGVANSFEASGPCRLLQDGQELALEGYQAEGWMDDRLFPFEVDLPLDGVTGEVVVQCETDDPSGGAEGNGPAIDTRTITVR